MEGISKERLLNLVYQLKPGSMFTSDHNLIMTREELLSECKELNEWKLIESAPCGEWLLVFDGIDKWISKNIDGIWYVDIGVHAMPTHWQELPEDPVI